MPRLKRKHFERKEILIKKGAQIKHISLCPACQFFLSIVFLAFLFWTAQTSALYFFGNEIVVAKENELRQKEAENKQLAAELAYYKGRVEQAENLATSLQETHKDILEKVDGLVSEEIKNAEDHFQRVSKTLKQSGLSLDQFVSKMKNTKEGVGGPFIPDTAQSLVDAAFSQKLTYVYDRLDYLENLSLMKGLIPISQPLEHIRVTAAFGKRQDPFTGQLARHEGIDLGAPRGTPVYVTAPGVVKRAFTNGAYGKFVEVEHELGFITRYAHLDEILVQKGTSVEIGDVIGRVGNTGRSTGDHLHYEILVGQKPINPYRFILTERSN